MAAAVESWPSVSQMVSIPWRQVTAQSGRKTTTKTVLNEDSTPHTSATRLPEFLQQTTSPALVAQYANSTVKNTDIRAFVGQMGRVGLRASNPILRPPRFQARHVNLPHVLQPLSPSSPLGTARYMSSSSRLVTRNGLHAPSFASSGHRFFGSVNGVPRTQLSTTEANANRDPTNASLQNAFYNLLLRANMPQLILQRHGSGRFASDAATQELCSRANALLSGAMAQGSIASMIGGNPTGQLNPSVSAPPNGSGNMHQQSINMGQKGYPMHVVLEESRASYIFRWIKFIATFVVFTYLSFAAVTILIEVLSTFRRPHGAKPDSEVTSEKQTTRFTDVHGCPEAKEELQEVVEFLRHPEKFQALGAKLPKGVLLVGPPGTGKTLLARAVAGEAGVPFFYMSGSEFDEVFVGVGAKRVRDLFTNAKAKSPAIIFIDELDAVGGKRNPRDQAHAKQTLNQLLTELDGFDQDARIVVIAATNTPKMLDKALVRPGRFDRHVNVDLPDVRGRIDILKHHAKKIKLSPSVDLESIAARSAGHSGAELENMLNIAALKASRAKATSISKDDLDWAYDRVVMGSEKRSMVITQKEKEMTAYHEAGHALVQLFDKENDMKLYKVTILPKGPSLGHTAFLPPIDKYSHTAAEYMSRIRVSLGGKMAEELAYGGDKVTSGVAAVRINNPWFPIPIPNKQWLLILR